MGGATKIFEFYAKTFDIGFIRAVGTLKDLP